MKEIIQHIARFQKGGKKTGQKGGKKTGQGTGQQIAIARMVDKQGSTPRELGAAMAVTSDGEVAGSVSGGCVEGAVVTEALEVLQDGKPRVTTFGYSDEEAFEVGLTCGGTLHIFIEPYVPIYDSLIENLTQKIPAVLATIVEGPNIGAKLLLAGGEIQGDLGNEELNKVVAKDALGQLETGKTGMFHYGQNGERRETTLSIFIESFSKRPLMIVFGAVDFTGALVSLAQILGWQTVVCDARAIFATKARFPTADEIIVGWPDEVFDRYSTQKDALTEKDAVCILTHDPKFDVPAIQRALKTKAGYIGVMGSRKTHASRLDRLKEEGIADAEIARLRAPIGLDIGARTPEETALSILSEITAIQQGRQGTPLSQTDGPIHANGNA